MSTGVTRPLGELHAHPYTSPRLTAYSRDSFIEYNSRYDAEDAVRKLHGTELNGVKVSVVEDVRLAALPMSARAKFTKLAFTVRLARRRWRTRP